MQTAGHPAHTGDDPAVGFGTPGLEYKVSLSFWESINPALSDLFPTRRTPEYMVVRKLLTVHPVIYSFKLRKKDQSVFSKASVGFQFIQILV